MKRDYEPFALASLGVAGGSLLVLQFCTNVDPIGRCFTFWSQLRKQVSPLRLLSLQFHSHCRTNIAGEEAVMFRQC